MYKNRVNKKKNYFDQIQRIKIQFQYSVKEIESVKMADTLDMVNRDPNEMNSYIQVTFGDVL